MFTVDYKEKEIRIFCCGFCESFMCMFKRPSLVDRGSNHTTVFVCKHRLYVPCVANQCHPVTCMSSTKYHVRGSQATILNVLIMGFYSGDNVGSSLFSSSCFTYTLCVSKVE